MFSTCFLDVTELFLGLLHHLSLFILFILLQIVNSVTTSIHITAHVICYITLRIEVILLFCTNSVTRTNSFLLPVVLFLFDLACFLIINMTPFVMVL